MTKPSSHPRRLWRSMGAMFLGLFAIVFLSIGTDQVLHVLKVYPPWGQPMVDALFLLATAYRIVFGVTGCYIAARFAPDRPMQHALALGVVGLAVSIIGAVATWGRVPDFGPTWYSLAIVLIALPCAWLGGVLQRVWHADR